MCSKSFIYIIWFILSSYDIKERAYVIPVFQLKNLREENRATCLPFHSMSDSGVAEDAMFAHCQSSLFSISPYPPYSLRCRPLRNWACRGRIICFKIGCLLQVCVFWYNFNKCIIACFSMRDDIKVKKYTCRNEMKIINKALFHFHYSKPCSLRLQSQYDVNRTIKYDSYHT